MDSPFLRRRRPPRAAWLVVLGALTACGWQRYEPAALDRDAAPRAVASARLDDAALGAELQRLGAVSDWPPATWSPAQLGLLAALRSAEVSAARAALATAVAARAVAGQRANPSVGLALEHHSDHDGGRSHWSVGPSIEFTLSPISRRRLAVALADTEIRAAGLAALESAWQARDAARAAAEDALAQGTLVALSAAEVEARERAVSAARAQVAAGLRDAFEWQSLELDANDARLARLDRERERAVAEGALAGALHVAPEALAGLVIAAAADDGPPDGATLQRLALEQHPRVLAALADYDRAEHELALAVAAQYPDVRLAPGYFFDQGDNVWSLVGGVVVPLFARHDAAIEQARRARDAAAERFRAVQGAIIDELHVAWAAWRAADIAARASRAVAADIAASGARLAAREAEGVVDSLVAARARLQQAEVALRVADAEARARQARRALENASRAPLGDAAFARLLDELLTTSRVTEESPP